MLQPITWRNFTRTWSVQSSAQLSTKLLISSSLKELAMNFVSIVCRVYMTMKRAHTVNRSWCFIFFITGKRGFESSWTLLASILKYLNKTSPNKVKGRRIIWIQGTSIHASKFRTNKINILTIFGGNPPLKIDCSSNLFFLVMFNVYSRKVFKCS